MSQPKDKHGEAMFIILLRTSQARNLFTAWINDNKNARARIDDGRRYLFDHNSLNLFMVTWRHNWDDVTIWDTWNRRHIHG
jgi:hypothetical protein